MHQSNEAGSSRQGAYLHVSSWSNTRKASAKKRGNAHKDLLVLQLLGGQFDERGGARGGGLPGILFFVVVLQRKEKKKLSKSEIREVKYSEVSSSGVKLVRAETLCTGCCNHKGGRGKKKNTKRSVLG